MHRSVTKRPGESGSCSCSGEEGGDGGNRGSGSGEEGGDGWNRGSGPVKKERMGTVIRFQGKKRQRGMRTIVGHPWQKKKLARRVTQRDDAGIYSYKNCKE